LYQFSEHLFHLQLRQRSVLDTEVEAKAFLEITGKQLHSEGFREPEPAE
jgi:hypothetical protein